MIDPDDFISMMEEEDLRPAGHDNISKDTNQAWQKERIDYDGS